MAKVKPNEAQSSLKLLFIIIGGLVAVLCVVKFLIYFLSSPGMASTFAVMIAAGFYGFNQWQQHSRQAAQEEMMTQHRTFFAEVERAWERSHPDEADRRQRERQQFESRGRVQQAAAKVEEPQDVTVKKKKAKKSKDDLVVVEDDLEADVVEDVEDFLLHARLRGKLKGAASDLRDAAKRKVEKEERRRQIEDEKLHPEKYQVKGLPPPPASHAPEKVQDAKPKRSIYKADNPPEEKKQKGKGSSKGKDTGRGGGNAQDGPESRSKGATKGGHASGGQQAESSTKPTAAGKGGASAAPIGQAPTHAVKGGASVGHAGRGRGSGAQAAEEEGGQGSQWDAGWDSPAAWAGGFGSGAGDWQEESWQGNDSQWWADDQPWAGGWVWMGPSTGSGKGGQRMPAQAAGRSHEKGEAAVVPRGDGDGADAGAPRKGRGRGGRGAAAGRTDGASQSEGTVVGEVPDASGGGNSGKNPKWVVKSSQSTSADTS